MMRSLSNELSRRARYLTARDGMRWIIGQELELPELQITISNAGTLVIERSDDKLIYEESPTGVIIRTSPTDELEEAIDILRKYMVLDDMAEVSSG